MTEIELVDSLTKLQLAMYSGTVCRICGTVVADEDIESGKWAGSVVHAKCWDAGIPYEKWHRPPSPAERKQAT